MTTTFKNGLVAAAFGAILGLSAFSARAAPPVECNGAGCSHASGCEPRNHGAA